MRKVLVLNPADNIAICLADMDAGTVIDQDNLKLTITQKIPNADLPLHLVVALSICARY